MNSFNWTDTPLYKKLGIRCPILQGALGGLNSQPLTAKVSNFGGLGSFGAHGLSPDNIHRVIEELREKTAKPFAINLWVSMEDDGAFTSNQEAFAKSLKTLIPSFQQLGGPLPAFEPYRAVRFEDQVRVVIDRKVPVLSFIFGVPPKEILQECRRHGIVTIGGATTPEEALRLDEAEVDAIVASGFEGGGHRGSFLRPGEDSLYGTFSLVPQIVDLVRAPVIAAGGVADARGFLAALTLGAQAVQIGTAFLGAKESGATSAHRAAILEGRARRTQLTKGLTGRLARGIENHLMDLVNDKDTSILPYPLQRILVKNLISLAEKRDRPDLMQLWAGQSASLSRYEDPEIFLQRLLSEAKTLAAGLAGWTLEKPT